MGLLSAFDGWKPRHLLAAWGTYWAGLVALALAPAAPALWRVTHLPSGQGRVEAGIGDGLAKLEAFEAGRVVWSGAVDTTTMLVALAVPPLVLWALWVARRSRTALPAQDAAVAIGPGAYEPAAAAVRTPERVERARRDRVD